MATFAAISDLVRQALHRPRRADAPCPPGTVKRLTFDSQIARLATVITEFVNRAAAGRSYHAAAERQIDAAAYALGSLMDDLSAVMTLAPRRTASVVAMQRPAPAAPILQSKGAIAA